MRTDPLSPTVHDQLGFTNLLAGRSWQIRELIGIKPGGDCGRLPVKDRRLAFDGQLCLQRREVHHDVDRCRERDTDMNTLAVRSREALQGECKCVYSPGGRAGNR